MLNEQRLDLDRRLGSLADSDPNREALWLELEPVLNKMREVVSDLSKLPATRLPDVQAKAAVLAALIRPERSGHGAIVPETEKSALTLSLTDDIVRLAGS